MHAHFSYVEGLLLLLLIFFSSMPLRRFLLFPCLCNHPAPILLLSFPSTRTYSVPFSIWFLRLPFPPTFLCSIPLYHTVCRLDSSRMSNTGLMARDMSNQTSRISGNFIASHFVYFYLLSIIPLPILEPTWRSGRLARNCVQTCFRKWSETWGPTLLSLFSFFLSHPLGYFSDLGEII